MDTTSVALFAARGRLAFGVLALAVPSVMAKAMTGRSARGAEPMFTRMWGGRDLALGLGVIVAVDHGVPVRGWLEAAAVADASDAVGALLSGTQLSANGRKATLAIGGLSAVLHAVLAQTMDPHPPAHPGQPEAIVTGHHEPA